MPQVPLMILPGLLEDADAFEHQIPGLAQVARSRTAELTRSDTIAGLAADALAQAPAERFALAGHSMGGYVALEIMRRAPQRVERLALLNTHARPDSPESTENRRRLMALAETDFPAVMAELAPKLVAPQHRKELGLIGKMSEMALATGKEAFLRQQRAIIGRIDSRPHLGAIRCKTLVLAGRDDAIMPVAWLEELANGIPGARLEVVEDCGHMASLEQPEQVTALLAEWLQ
ncbi:MAG TPA: alpha/beta fold hydrolase [Usitatibacter sp.]|nr:alpha/beta fold hydrolase [Usitatibacter sp.]